MAEVGDNDDGNDDVGGGKGRKDELGDVVEIVLVVFLLFFEGVVRVELLLVFRLVNELLLISISPVNEFLVPK